jgi:mRNA-degrading endonuclease RelE of RelBE toxin-antitoxin system
LEARRRFAIEVTREAERHLEWLSARDRATVFDTLDRRLAGEPTIENRNRKRLRPNPLAPWELRIGHLRVYFDVEEEPRRVVTIQAVGIKDRSRLLIGGEEVQLR